MGQLYDALVTANVPPDQARRASEEVAVLDTRVNTIERDLTILKWMVGTSITLQLITLGGMIGVV